MRHIILLLIFFLSSLQFAHAYGISLKSLPEDIRNISSEIFYIIDNHVESNNYIIIEWNEDIRKTFDEVVRRAVNNKHFYILERIEGRESLDLILSIPTSKRELIFKCSFYHDQKDKVVLDDAHVLLDYHNNVTDDITVTSQ